MMENVLNAEIHQNKVTLVLLCPKIITLNVTFLPLNI